MPENAVKQDAPMDYGTAKDILNEVVSCEPEEYVEAVEVATECVDLLVEIAKMVNEPAAMSSLTVEKIRKKCNKTLRHSEENYIYEW